MCVESEQCTLGASHDHAALRSNVDAGNSLVMTLELILECKIGARALVELDVVV